MLNDKKTCLNITVIKSTMCNLIHLNKNWFKLTIISKEIKLDWLIYFKYLIWSQFFIDWIKLNQRGISAFPIKTRNWNLSKFDLPIWGTFCTLDTLLNKNFGHRITTLLVLMHRYQILIEAHTGLKVPNGLA